MTKIDQKKEKRERNEEYAKKFEKKKTSKTKRKGTWINWCRNLGHPASCQCSYPARSEIKPSR